MTRRNKWAIVLSAANAAVAVAAVIVLYAMFAAIAAFAASVTSGPLLILVLTGLILSPVCLFIAKGLDSRFKKIGAYVVNGSALIVHLFIVAWGGWIVFATVRVTFVVPVNYMGDIFIIHNVADGGVPEISIWGTTYHIPENGIFRSRLPMYRGLELDNYYRERSDRTLEQIREYWPTTIQRTPENLANNTEIGVFFPRSGTMTTTSNQCPVEYERFFVGTKAFLLKVYQEVDLSQYFAEHPVVCPDIPATPLQPAPEKRGG